MSQIFRQGLNWVIVDHISNLDPANKMLESVTTEDWHAYTSAKGTDSHQHYIINPSWMPSASHKEPEGWPDVRRKWEQMVQREIVNYGLMPTNWRELHACSAWTVTGEEGSYHTVHEHGPMNICSVTYLKVPKGQESPAGQIYFILHADGYNPLSTPAFRVFHIQPQEGMIVIFPSWLLHGVYPQGPGLRQTLNIDFNGDPNYKFNIPHSGSASYG